MIGHKWPEAQCDAAWQREQKIQVTSVLALVGEASLQIFEFIVFIDPFNKSEDDFDMNRPTLSALLIEEHKKLGRYIQTTFKMVFIPTLRKGASHMSNVKNFSNSFLNQFQDTDLIELSSRAAGILTESNNLWVSFIAVLSPESDLEMDVTDIFMQVYNLVGTKDQRTLTGMVCAVIDEVDCWRTVFDILASHLPAINEIRPLWEKSLNMLENMTVIVGETHKVMAEMVDTLHSWQHRLRPGSLGKFEKSLLSSMLLMGTVYQDHASKIVSPTPDDALLCEEVQAAFMSAQACCPDCNASATKINDFITWFGEKAAQIRNDGNSKEFMFILTELKEISDISEVSDALVQKVTEAMQKFRQFFVCLDPQQEDITRGVLDHTMQFVIPNLETPEAAKLLLLQ